MKINLKDLVQEFGNNLKLDYDLKKKIGLIQEVKQKFSIRQIV